jgi:hypothetical protein
MWESYESSLEQHLRVPAWGAWLEKNKVLFSTSLVEQVERTRRRVEAERGNA